MGRILKPLVIVLFVFALVLGELPLWTGARHTKGLEEVHRAAGEAQPELTAEGEITLGWNGVHAAAWGFEYIMLLFAGGWALVMQIFRSIRDEINK